jgi:PleD family two-component response regulator
MSIMEKKAHYKIILADDDEDDRLLFREALSEKNKATLETAKDGMVLMDMIRRIDYIPDAIFLDLNMPRKDGYQCLQELKSDMQLRCIPVVIYSTSSSKRYIDETYEQGASLYIMKPDTYSKLLKMIDQVFELDCENYIPQPPRNKFVFQFN